MICLQLWENARSLPPIGLVAFLLTVSRSKDTLIKCSGDSGSDSMKLNRSTSALWSHSATLSARGTHKNVPQHVFHPFPTVHLTRGTLRQQLLSMHFFFKSAGQKGRLEHVRNWFLL